MKETTRYRLSTDVLTQHVEDATVIVHLGTNQIYELNGTAARLWDLLSQGCAPAEVIERLGQEYDVDKVSLAGEVENMMQSLVAQGLVVADAA
jgi:hypothetical protein